MARRTRSGARSARRRATPAATASPSARSSRRPALQRTYAGRLDGCLDFLLMQALRRFFAFRESTRERARRVPPAALRLLRGCARAAVVPRQPRHEPLPVGRRRRRAAAAARGAVPVRAARAADRLLRHRARPVPAPGRALCRRQRPPRGVTAADALGHGRGPVAARVLRRARPAASGARGPVARASSRSWRWTTRPACTPGAATTARPRRSWRSTTATASAGWTWIRRAGWTLALATDDGPSLGDGRLHLPPFAGAVLAGPARRGPRAGTGRIVA